MVRHILYFNILLCAASVAYGASARVSDARNSTNQLIIHLADSHPLRGRQMRLAEAIPDIRLPNGRSVTFVRNFRGDGVVVRLPKQVSLEEAHELADLLAADPAIVSAFPDKRMVPALVPSDAEYARQWHLHEPTAGIRMPEAWDLQTGSSQVVIALLDTGIISHADLEPARMLSGYDFISDIDTANDGDARDADNSDPGDAVVFNECGIGEPETSSSWHGLATAGVMVAESNNFQNISGIDFAARLLPVRVLGKCGGFISDIVDAMRWAAGLPVSGVPDNPDPANIVNLSLSGLGACSREEQRAIDDVVGAGALVVVAAGNASVDTANQSPANCRNVVVVGAVARDGVRASYVNTGPQVDLSAPGGDGEDGILTLFNAGRTAPGADTLATIQGSSFAAAQVSAVAALMLATNNNLSPELLEELLARSSRPFDLNANCEPCSCGQGILDAKAALDAAANPAMALAAASDAPICIVDSGGSAGGGGCVSGSARKFDPLLISICLFLVMRAGMRRVLV